jgi:hypothetical protein
MKFLIRFIILALLLSAFRTGDGIVIDKAEAKKAFSLLQEIRNNSKGFFRELGFDSTLKKTAIQLQWNDTLAKVAEKKAYDMANRNYFAHVDPDGNGLNYFINKSGYKLNSDWTKSKSDNYFESLAANNETGEEAIKDLIIDSNTPSFGHRNHLLGLDNWNASLTDIGIGFSRRDSGSTYKTYTCVIIAKHNW